MKRARGFTLLELMIVVAVVAVLAMVAMNAYGKQIRKSRRAEGKQAIAAMTLREEKYRSSNTTYGTCNQVAGPDPASTTACASFNSGLTYYTIAVTANTGTRFTLTATPKLDQTKDSCGTLTFDSNAGTITKSPTTGDCW